METHNLRRTAHRREPCDSEMCASWRFIGVPIPSPLRATVQTHYLRYLRFLSIFERMNLFVGSQESTNTCQSKQVCPSPCTNTQKQNVLFVRHLLFDCWEPSPNHQLVQNYEAYWYTGTLQVAKDSIAYGLSRAFLRQKVLITLLFLCCIFVVLNCLSGKRYHSTGTRTIPLVAFRYCVNAENTT